MTDSPAPDAASNAAAATPKKTPLLFPSRIILFSILPFALAALGYDYYQRAQRDAVYHSVAKMVPTDSEPNAEQPLRFQDSDIAIENIHKVIGRDADKTVDDKTQLQEIYAWRGVLYTHTVRITYTKGFLKGTKPLVEGVYRESQLGSL
jgi:hypothetical protein